MSSLYALEAFKLGPVRVGVVFSMVTEAVLLVLSPSESVAVAMHSILSPTLVSDWDTV